jgi:hypothetical protein
MLLSMMLMTPGAMNVREKCILVPNLMALVKKTTRSLVRLLKDTMNRNWQETGLRMAT